ncbi:MAG: hypothetical protein FWG98_09115 [Candidatus Cloacimonetes bacterium]|nr:hypothetical protein [Candidatus Cloacimonadota bacterium]
MSILLEQGAIIVAEYTISWWNTLESEDGSGNLTLDDVNLSTFYPRIIGNRFEPLGEHARWRLNAHNTHVGTTANISIYSPYFGNYYIDILPPHHIRLSGIKGLGQSRDPGMVRFETEIDLFNGIEDVKIRTKHSWKFLYTIKTMTQKLNEF